LISDPTSQAPAATLYPHYSRVFERLRDRRLTRARSRPRAVARTEAAELREAIFDAGYATSGVRYLIGASPAHERVGARRNSGYRLRGVQPAPHVGSR